MKTHIQKSNKKVKWKRKRCAQGLQIDPNNCLFDVQEILLILLTITECSYVLNL